MKNVYNLNGQNIRVYNNSNEHSTPHLNEESESGFNLLKGVRDNKITDNEKRLVLLEEMHQSKGSGNYLAKNTNFIANSTNYMTLISPFIPARTALISGH
ncbi:hypothetical protein NAF17_14855 [Mucilaginibacter sp. RB4R14]|uniref:hypothetical protein n=1 Tax=Mucilaginibacter aurantiaciroseus TaxID=2949308 RepID=UPI0020915B9F|nr:hypothetical protein [Mucilaginibacter aurantiaciroseus]MCO5936820.1 hypothetical protein [Mucilaginibacter aurantiaciroseus]